MLLQSEEELLLKRTSEPAKEGAVPKPKKVIGKMKVQGSFFIPVLMSSPSKTWVLGCPQILFILQSVK